MGLGILASCAAIPKFISLRRLGTNYDWTWEAAKVDLWSLLEMSLGIFATSMIALKGVLENILTRLHLFSTISSARAASTGVNYSSIPPGLFGDSSQAITEIPDGEPQIHQAQINSESRPVMDIEIQSKEDSNY
jgi:hypothetical protein